MRLATVPPFPEKPTLRTRRGVRCGAALASVGSTAVFVLAGAGCDGRGSPAFDSPARVVVVPERAPPSATPAVADLTSIVVTIPPLRSLVEALVPDGVRVTSLVPSGRSVHGWEPGGAEVVQVSQASLVLAVGHGLESGVLERVLPLDRTWRMDLIVGLDPISAGTHTHSHADGDECLHEGPDPHLWLDTALVARWVGGIARGLIACGPEAGIESAATELRAEDLLQRLRELDDYAAARLSPYEGQAIVTHHAAFGRFAERYGLVIAGVVLPAPGTEPSASELVALRRAIADQDARAVFTERQFGAQAANRLRGLLGERAADGRPIVFGSLDPLGDGDYFAMMRANIDAIADGLSRASAPPAG